MSSIISGHHRNELRQDVAFQREFDHRKHFQFNKPNYYPDDHVEKEQKQTKNS